MKKLLLLSLCVIAILIISSCGAKQEVKSQVKPEQPKQEQTKPAEVKPAAAPAAAAPKPEEKKPAYDKMNDTSFNNVMTVLKESLDEEKKAGGIQQASLKRLKLISL